MNVIYEKIRLRKIRKYLVIRLFNDRKKEDFGIIRYYKKLEGTKLSGSRIVKS